MASCPRCTRKLNKRTDNWYHCRNCGPVREVSSPIVKYTEILKLSIKQAEPKISKQNIKTKIVSVVDMDWNIVRGSNTC